MGKAIAWASLVTGVLATLGCGDVGPARVDLKAGRKIPARLAPGASVRFVFDLQRDEFLDLAVSQTEADVVLSVRLPGQEPGQEKVLRLDTSSPVTPPERLLLVAPNAGRYALDISGATPAEAGRIQLEVLADRPATPRDRIAALASARLAAAEEFRRVRDAASEERALPLYAEAARLSAGIGDSQAEAYARMQRAKVLGRRNRHQEAADEWTRALNLSPAAERPADRAGAATELAKVLVVLGRAGETPALLQEALGLWRQIGVRKRVALVENELGLRAQERGELAEAEGLFLAAIADREAAGSDLEVAKVTGNLAALYVLAGEGQLALDATRRASRLLPADAPDEDRGWLLEQTGEALARLGRRDEARTVVVQARELYRADGDRGALAQADRRLSRLAYSRGRFGEAAERQAAALASFQATGDLPSEVAARQDLAWIELKKGRLDVAERQFSDVLSRVRQTENRWIEAGALTGLAQVERARGHLDRALVRARQALGAAEDLRAEAGRADLGASVFANLQSFFDLATELLVLRYRETGDRKLLAEAFEVSERSHARWLLDLVAAPSGEAPSLDANVESRAVGQADERLRRLQGEGATAGRIALADGDLRAALLALRRRAAMSSTSAGSAGSASSKRLSTAPRSLAAIQGALGALDRETSLLEFDLGDEQSFLWVVSREGLALHLLPGRLRIESLVARAVEVLSSPGIAIETVQGQEVLADAANVLLGDALPTLGVRRWLVVADGALHSLPLGALPDPLHAGQPILASREVVYAPSASVAVQLGQRNKRRSGPAVESRVELAMFADPVYGRDDRRLGAAAVIPRPGENPGAAGVLDLARLLDSGREARRILTLVPAAQRIAAVGVEANKQRVLSGELATARILHFAVHGLPNAEHPELSSLALSRYGPDGRVRDGMLHAYEIARLPLSADLAVLSACRSGQGAEIAGEGLVGLAHAFLSAGTARVVVSYWPVQDAATAELMARFYDGLLRDGLSPSRALQKAQLSLAADARWRHPYYWAGFAVQGGF